MTRFNRERKGGNGMKKYRWNARKCISNLAAGAVIIAGSLLLGIVFALWAMA